MMRMPTSANLPGLNRWGLISKLIIIFAFCSYNEPVYSEEITPVQNSTPFLIDSFYGASSENDSSYYGVNLGIISTEHNHKHSYYGLLKFAHLDDKKRASQGDDLDEFFLGAGLQLNGTLTPYIEAGLDVFDPGSQIFDRFEEGFEILINEIFNNNFEDCRDDDTCTSIQFDRYIKIGVKARLNRSIVAGVFYERATINSEDGIDSVYYNIFGAHLGVRF